MKLKSPGSDDLIQRLQRLEGRIGEATRGSTQRDYAKIYTGNSFTHAGGEARYQDSWYGIPEVDTTGNPFQQIPGTMVKVNQPSPNAGGALATWFELPYGGRWRAKIVAAFDNTTTSDRDAGCWMKLNQDADPGWNTSTMIGYSAVRVGASPGVIRVTADAERVFAPGDHISFGFWSSGSGVKILGANELPKMPTYASIEFMGPS